MRDGTLALHAMADGAVVVRGDIAFAIAPPRSGPLRRERAWTHGLAFDEPERSATQISAFGGRWPDLAFLTLESESGRVAALYSVLRWQDSAWTREVLPASAGFIPYYVAHAGVPDGPVVGLRSHAREEDTEELDPDEPVAKKPPRAPRPLLDRMTAEGRTTGPWPALPAGPAATDLLALANGDFVVVRSGPVVQHWAAGGKSWKTLPAVGYKATGYYDSPTIAGRDPTRLYLASCPDTADDVAPNFHMFDGTRWIRLTTPGDHCVYSVSESEDGTVWIVADDTLHRDDPGEPRRWEPVRLANVTLPGREAAWRPGSYGEPWRDYPAEPASEQALTPYHVLAFGPDDIWVAATADASRYREPYRRSVVLTTRASKSVLVLPDDDLADIEAHAQEPEVVPTSRESACENIVLDLGETSDVPATARPPALTAALGNDETDLRRLSVVSVDLGDRHGVQALWLANSPTLEESYALLAGLAERLRGAHPRVRLLCRTPIITGVLP